MWRVVPVLLAISGCSRQVEREAIAGAPLAPVVTAGVPLRGVPHGASIREVSVDAAGDAAISIDLVGGIRVWPALDGTREPVAVRAVGAVQAALVRDGDQLVAAILDSAGSAHVVRIGARGDEIGRVQLAGEVAIEQIVATRRSFLVRRADQAIELVDPRGVVRGRIAAEPGEQIARVVARGDAALAVIAGSGGTTRELRWIEAGRWGARLTLPSAVWEDTVAVSPSKQRIAAAEAKSRQLFVFDLAAKPAVVLGTSVTVAVGERLGFTAEDRVAAIGPAVRYWTAAKPGDDPWAATTPPTPATTSSVGVAVDGLVVACAGGSLALLRDKSARYLGWQDSNVIETFSAGDGLAIKMDPTNVAWLDNALRDVRHADVPRAPSFVMPIDAHHLLAQWPLKDEIEVALVDADHLDVAQPIASVAGLSRMEYEPRSHVVGLWNGTVEQRYQLDLARGTATRLPELATRGDAQFFKLLDPAAAGGALAIEAIQETGASVRIDAFVEQHGKAVVTRRGSLPGVVFAVDDTGHVFTWQPGTVLRDGVVVASAVDGSPHVDRTGALISVAGAGGVTMYDASGTVRWRAPIWSVFSTDETADGKRMLVRAAGGIALLDTATGERVATACGWRFGLHDTAPVAPTASDSLCEDSER